MSINRICKCSCHSSIHVIHFTSCCDLCYQQYLNKDESLNIDEYMECRKNYYKRRLPTMSEKQQTTYSYISQNWIECNYNEIKNNPYGIIKEESNISEFIDTFNLTKIDDIPVKMDNNSYILIGNMRYQVIDLNVGIEIKPALKDIDIVQTLLDNPISIQYIKTFKIINIIKVYQKQFIQYDYKSPFSCLFISGCKEFQ